MKADGMSNMVILFGLRVAGIFVFEVSSFIIRF